MNGPRLDIGPVTVFFGEKNGKYPDGNQVIVTGADGKAVFDTPLLANRLENGYEGADLVILGHAHEDHCAGMHLLPGVPLYAPEADLAAVQSVAGMLAHYGYAPETAERMRVKIEREFFFRPRPDALGYADGRRWELGGGVSVRAVHMPGHTRGHSVLLVEPGPLAFIGDIDLTGFGPYYGDACSDLREFKDTLARIEHLEARAWITFHHKGVIRERATFLELLGAFRDKIDRREEAILAAIGPGGRTLSELVAHRFMYPRGYQDVFVEDAERMCLEQHLSILAEQGRVRLADGRFLRSGRA
jgi:glyoxylase-like metal-dependent hydrolase (beta-lactamase superfamily II)